jgi:predicted Zn-dependent peptidase
MLLKHTKQYTEKELLSQITTLGGSYNAVTDRDVTFYYILTHMDNYKKSVDIVHSVMTEPVFKKYELDLERKVVFEEISRRQDNDGNLYNLSYLSVLGIDNPYAQPIEGYTKTLNNVNVEELNTYFKDRYKDVMIFINCDKSKKKEVENYVLSKFGVNKPLQNYTEIPVIYKGLNFESKIFVVPKKYGQYTTHLMFPSFPRSMIKENIVLNFVKYCLSSSGLYSILMFQLRSKRGLIYSISSINENYRYLGILRVIIQTSDKDTSHILSIVLDILQKLKKNGLTDKLIKYYKQGYLNEQKYAFTNDEYNTIFHSEGLFYGCDMTIDEYLTAIKSITSEDIKEISRKIFDFNKIGIFSYGNYKNADNIEKNMKEMIESYNALQT